MILPYVEKDPSAFYTADEFKTAYTTLKQFCHPRRQKAQLLSARGSAESIENNIQIYEKETSVWDNDPTPES